MAAPTPLVVTVSLDLSGIARGLREVADALREAAARLEEATPQEVTE